MPSVMRIAAVSDLPTEAVSVYHFATAGTATVSDANDCIAELEAFYEAFNDALAAQDIRIGDRVTVVNTTPNTLLAATPAVVVCTGSGNAVASAAGIASWQTAKLGPRYRGRNYLGPLPLASVNSDGRTINAGLQGAIVAAGVSLIANLAATSPLVVYSRKYNTWEPVVNVACPSVLGTIRGRLR